jgi:hypothetical protein
MTRSAGRTAVGIVAYATGQRMKDNETGKWCKRNHPGDVLEWGTTIPPNAPAWLADKEKLSDAWNASTAAEKRKDSELAKHWNIALPRQSTPDQQGELMRGMAQKITDRYGVMVTWAVHEAPEHGDDRNAHGHLVLGTRIIDENGFGPKAAGLNGPKRKAELVWQREMFADTINRYLDGQGIDERVSAKSYKDRGIDQEPTLHMGNAVNQAELNGERTSIGDENRARKARNAERDGERDSIDKAMTYLEELGTRTMTDEEQRRIQGLIDDLTPRQSKVLQAYSREEIGHDHTLKVLTGSGVKPKDAADIVESIIPLSPEAQKHISAFVAEQKADMSRESRVDVDHAARREALAAKAAFEASETLRRESLNARTTAPAPAPRESVADAGDRHPLTWTDGAGMVQQQQAANRAFRRSAAQPEAQARVRSVSPTVSPPSQPSAAYDPMRDFVTDATKREVGAERAARAINPGPDPERGGRSR